MKLSLERLQGNGNETGSESSLQTEAEEENKACLAGNFMLYII